MWARPRTSRWISPALSKTLMCFEAAASDMAKGSASWPTVRSPRGEFEKHAPARGVAERVKHGTELKRL